MTNYTVTQVEHITYQIDVVSDSKESAEIMAHKFFNKLPPFDLPPEHAEIVVDTGLVSMSVEETTTMETNTGELSIILPLTIAIVPAKPPYTYLGVAETMLPGVHILATTRPLAALPLALVSAHVLECALKAYLSRSGNDDHLRKQDVRHNLNKLWELACSEGLNIQVQPPQWVNSLSHLHDKPYYLRYSTGIHGLGTPAPEPMTTELTKIVEQVNNDLGKPSTTVR